MKAQAALPFPERIEIEQIAFLNRCYGIWCYHSNGEIEPLTPLTAYGEGEELETVEWFVAGLKTAVLAAMMRWGGHVPIDLSRVRHSGALRIREAG